MKKLTALQIHQVFEQLAIEWNKETAEYKNADVTDRTIAERVGGVSVYSVQKIRQENFGLMRQGRGPGTRAEIVDRLAAVDELRRDFQKFAEAMVAGSRSQTVEIQALHVKLNAVHAMLMNSVKDSHATRTPSLNLPPRP